MKNEKYTAAQKISSLFFFFFLHTTMVRLKTRYLLFEIIYPDSLNSNNLNDKLQTHVDLRQPSDSSVDARKLSKLFRDSVQEFYGDYGSGVLSSTIAVKYFSPVTNSGILRVNRDHFRIAWGMLTNITEINNRKCIITVTRVSGTIKKCEQAVIKRDSKDIGNVLLRFEDDDMES